MGRFSVLGDGIITRECGCCKKLFVPAPQHIYKLMKNHKLVFYCSYTCWRKEGGDSGKISGKIDWHY